MDAPPPNLNVAPPDFNPNVPPPINKCPINYSYNTSAYPSYSFPSYCPYGYNTSYPYSHTSVPYSPNLPPPSPSHNQLPFSSHGPSPSIPHGPPPPTTHSLSPTVPHVPLFPPGTQHMPPPPQPSYRPPSTYVSTTDSTICPNAPPPNYYSYSCPPPPGCYAPLPPPPVNPCPPPAPPPPARHRTQPSFRTEKSPVPSNNRNTTLIQIELKKTPRPAICSPRKINSPQSEQDNVKRSSSLPNLSHKSIRSERNISPHPQSSISRTRRRSQENERPYKSVRYQSRDESERDRLLKTWRSQYCETSEEITRRLAELANCVEKEVWIRSSPAELYYKRTNNGCEVDSTIRSDTLCQVFEEELVKRSEKVNNIQKPYNPPPRARKKRLCRHKCK